MKKHVMKQQKPPELIFLNLSLFNLVSQNTVSFWSFPKKFFIKNNNASSLFFFN